MDIEVGNELAKSANAERIIAASQTEARIRGHPFLASEHLLHSLLRASENPGSMMFIVLEQICQVVPGNTTPEALRNQADNLLNQHPLFSRNNDPCPEDHVMPTSPAYDEIMALCRQLLVDPYFEVTTEMLFAAIVMHGSNVAADIVSRVSQGQATPTLLAAMLGVPVVEHMPQRMNVHGAEIIEFDNVQPLNDDDLRQREPFPFGSPLPIPDQIREGPSYNSNWLIPDYLCIGMSPNAEDVRELQIAGVTTFVCLQQEEAHDFRAGNSYTRHAGGFPAKFILFEIVDMDIPEDAAELQGLVFMLKDCISRGECVFVHCYGGHGRTGTVVIPLVAALYNVSSVEAREYVTECTRLHRRADGGRRNISMPETGDQRRMVAGVDPFVRLRSR